VLGFRCAPPSTSGERLGGQLNPELHRVVDATRPMLGQQRNRLGVERDPAVLMGLGVLLPRHAVQLRDRPLHGQHPAGEVDVEPAQRAQLAAPEAGHHRQPDQHGPVGVLPGAGEDARRLRGRWRPRVRSRLGRRLGVLDRVRRDPPPPDGPLQRAAQHDVDLPERRLGQASASVRPAAGITRVGPGRPVLDEGPAVAVRAAAAQLGVERVEHRGPQRADLLLADERDDVLVLRSA